MSAGQPRFARSDSPRQEEEANVLPDRPVALSDDSQRAMDEMAIAIARELGRQAARAWWEGKL